MTIIDGNCIPDNIDASTEVTMSGQLTTGGVPRDSPWAHPTHDFANTLCAHPSLYHHLLGRHS